MSKRREVVFGLDVMPGASPLSSKEPRYALAVVSDDGEIIQTMSDAPLRRIIRLAWEYKPKAIAIDNIFELGKNDREIIRLLNLLPPRTSLIQVTMTAEGTLKSIREAAKEAGVEVEEGYPEPLRTAVMAALLAIRGAGVRVKAVEEKTKIIVSKGRSVRAGGSSQDRYRRRIRGLILRLTREIKEKLEEEGLDYDLILRRSDRGLERGVFTVYAPHSRVLEVVKPIKTKDVKVTVRPIFKGKLEFELLELGSEASVKPYVIAGVDPGVVTGVAVIDLDGRLLLLKSGREMDREDIISLITSVGRPLVIATDVNPPPDTIVKLASTLQATVFTPSKPLSTAEKQELVMEYLAKVKRGEYDIDTHQRDALAAALKALNHYQSKLRQAETYLSRIDLDISVDNVKAMVIRGYSIAEALEAEIGNMLSRAAEEPKASEEVQERGKQSQAPSVERIVRKLRELSRERALLRRKVKELSRKLLEVERELEDVRRGINLELRAMREIRTLQDEVKRLSSEVRAARTENTMLKERITMLKNALIGVARGELRMAKVLDSLTLSSLSACTRMYGPLRKDDVVFVKSPSFYQEDALDALSESNVLCVVARGVPGHVREALEERLIPVIDLDKHEEESSLIVLDDELVLYRSSLTSLALERRRELEIQKREPKRSLRLEELVEEYRRERWKLLKSESIT